MKRFYVALLLLALLGGTVCFAQMPCNTVDCDNANGNPKLCTVEYDEPDGPCPPPKAVVSVTPAPAKTTMTMNAMPVTIIGGNGAATGSETDALVAALHPLSIGETTIVSNKLSFIGGRVDFTIKPISTWIQNHSSVDGYKFEMGPTFSFGGVKANSKFYYGQRAGMFINYKLAWAVGMQFEIQWNNFPGYAHNVPSFSFGPNCHW
jgi:hypothetical protein